MQETVLQTICPACNVSHHVDSVCYRCADNERMVATGLRHADLTPLPSAKMKVLYSPVAMLGVLEISNSGRGYWIVKGEVPLSIAKVLYADPAGKDLIRVAGHCGCPPPEAPWVDWVGTDGRKVIPVEEKKRCEELCTSSCKSLSDIATNILTTCTFHDVPESIGAYGYVDLYHIDGNLGLRVFVDILRKEGFAR